MLGELAFLKSSLIIWMSPFLVLGILVAVFIFTVFCKEIPVSKQC